MQKKTPELIAFVAVLATGLTLIALGVAPQSLGTITTALAALYLAWCTGRSDQNTPNRK